MADKDADIGCPALTSYHHVAADTNPRLDTSANHQLIVLLAAVTSALLITALNNRSYVKLDVRLKVTTLLLARKDYC